MVLGTVVSIVSPALSFVAMAVALGYLLSRVWRRAVVASLISSAAVCAAFVLFRVHLPSDFRYYAQDIIYEPLARDAFRPASETAASAIFHFAVPLGLLMFLARFPLGKNEKKA